MYCHHVHIIMYCHHVHMYCHHVDSFHGLSMLDAAAHVWTDLHAD